MSNEDYKLSPEDRKLLLKDLCARLPYGVRMKGVNEDFDLSIGTAPNRLSYVLNSVKFSTETDFKPYLRPMSSMTEEEAMEVAKISGLKDVLSVSVKENYISVEIDDGVAGCETYTIWFNEIVTSLEVLDWLVDNKFDYRGLIPKGLALEAKEGMYVE